MSIQATVAVTVTGNTGSVEVQADATLPIAAQVAGWAAQVSTSPPEDLLVVAEDHHALVDPEDTLASLGVGYGTQLRLVTGAEAMGLLDVQPLEPSSSPPPAARPDISSVRPVAPGFGHHPVVAGFDVGRPSGAAPAGPATASPPLSPLGSRTGLQAQHDCVAVASPEAARAAVATSPTASATSEGAALPRGHEPALGNGRDLAGLLPVRVSRTARWSRSLRAVLSAKSVVPAAPATGFAKAAVPGPAERWRLARQGSDRTHGLETIIRQAPLARCVVIAVVSPKGGAGKTSITALLSSLFAELRRDPVLAVDANPDFGNLADKMGAPAAHVDELAAWLAEHPAATPAELAARLGRGPHGARFLPTAVGDLDRMIATADMRLYSGLLGRLRDYEGIIVVDCGTGLCDPPVRAALDTADQVVMVTDSSADTAGLVVTASRYLREATPVWLAVNKMPAKGSMLDLERVRQAIPALRGMTVVPEVRLAENLITPGFDWSAAPGPWVEPLRELAARLAQGWADLS